MRNNGRRTLAAALAILLGFGCGPSIYASVIKDAENKRQEAQQNLDEVNEEINSIHAAQNSLQAQMERYDNELMGLLTDMEILQSDMGIQQQKIEDADAALVQAKKTAADQYESMKLRIRYMYENGNQSFLTAVAGADSITDFLNRIEYVSEVYEYDRNLLTEYRETVAEVEELTEQLDNEMEEMEELRLCYEEQQSSLETLIAQDSVKMSNFESQLADAQSLAGQYAQTIKEQNRIIEQEKARQAEEARKKKEAEEKRKAEEARKKKEAEEKRKAEEKKKKEEEQKKNTQTGTGASSGTKNTTDTSVAGTSAADTGGSSNAGESSGTSSSGSQSTTGLTDGGLNPSYSTGVSGSSIVSYAQQYLGAPYVYGGNSLTEGTDCSYFVMAVYAHFGVSLPRSSYAMASCGQAVSYENAKAGDIICYPGHVAIYMGNGQIIHASTPKTGVCYGTATYRTISTIRRVL